MSVRHLFYLYCNSQFHGGAAGNDYCGEGIKEVRSYGDAAGWKYKKVANGTFWDFCPRCWEKHQNECNAQGKE